MRYATLILAMAVAGAMGAPDLIAQGPPSHAGKGGQKQGPDEAQNRGQGQRPAQAGNRGQGQSQRPAQAGNRGQGQGQRPAQAGNRGQGAERRGPPAHARRGGPPPDVEAFNRGLVQRAANARGRRAGNASRVEVRRDGGELRVVRDDGQLLFSLDSDRAEELGYWRAVMAPTVEMAARDRSRDRTGGGIFDRVEDDEGRGPPAFCRSGEGHPVWGRSWCVDKGFGLGDDRPRWGRVTDIEDIVLRPRTDRERLDRGGLIDVLGDIVFGRLAVQSLVLGAEDPLTGTWISRDDGPRVLRVHAGDLPVAELVDADRDGGVEMLVVNLDG